MSPPPGAVGLQALVPVPPLHELITRARRRAFRRGEVLFRQGDRGDALYWLEQGQITVTATSQFGDEVILAILGPGAVFGELSVFDGQPRSATVRGAEDGVALILDRLVFQQLLRREPEVALHLLATLSLRLRSADGVIEDCAFVDVPGRLAKRLLDLAEEHGERTSEGVEIVLRLTQKELAGLVGASRELVNKCLAEFRRQGWIGQHGRRLVIRDWAALERRGRSLPPATDVSAP